MVLCLLAEFDFDAVRGAQTGKVNFFQKPHCGQISNMIYYALSRHQETIGRKAGRTNRVEHHGGSRRGDVPERETCSGKVARLEHTSCDRSFARGLSLPETLDEQERDNERTASQA